MSTVLDGYSNVMRNFRSNWLSGSYASIPVHFRNELSKPPVAAPWIECDVVWGAGTFLARDSTAIQGSLVVQVYTPKGQGTYSSSLLTDGAHTAFSSMSLQDFRFDVPSGPVNVPNDGPWFQRVMTVPFQMERTTP